MLRRPLASPRLSLIPDDGELRVVVDGLTKGYVAKYLHGWRWRCLRPSAFGETRTKAVAVSLASSGEV
jgi:hypothetical protein